MMGKLEVPFQPVRYAYSVREEVDGRHAALFSGRFLAIVE
jgi:hypothetical protein